MGKLGSQEHAAIEAVARHVSAKWETGGGDWSGGYLAIGGKRIAVNVAPISPEIAGRGAYTKPRLRFDKVALRLVGDLREGLSPLVPDGEAVIVTCTAPIRLRAKTVAALECRIQAALSRRGPRAEIGETVHGNQVRVRFVTGASKRTAKVIGFVHNPESDPDVLLHLTEALLRSVGAAVDKPRPEKFAGDRWLVVVDDGGVGDIDTVRHVWAALSPPDDFKKVLLVLAGGRIETLAG